MIEKILLKLEEIQCNGIAVEECTQKELIDFIAELKAQVNGVIMFIENNKQ